LDFYNASDVQTIENVLAEMNSTDADANAVDITKKCRSAMGSERVLERSSHYDPKEDRDYPGTKRASDLKKKFGILFHKCLELSLDDDNAKLPD
jgi:hypothetical protein